MDYGHALGWILTRRAGMGGWPPRDVVKVSGWLIVQFTAEMFNKSAREVAGDLIEYHILMEQLDVADRIERQAVLSSAHRTDDSAMKTAKGDQ